MELYVILLLLYALLGILGGLVFRLVSVRGERP